MLGGASAYAERRAHGSHRTYDHCAFMAGWGMGVRHAVHVFVHALQGEGVRLTVLVRYLAVGAVPW